MADVNNLFMKVDGVKGSSTDKDYKDWIVIDNFNLNVTNASSYDGSSGLTSGSNVYMTPVNISKTADVASIPLIDLLQQAKPVKEIILVKTQHINDKRIEERRITLKDCFIAAYDSQLQNVSGPTHESFVLAYGIIQQEMNTVTSDGKASKQGPIGWNRLTNSKL